MLKVKILKADAQIPLRASNGSVGYDLYACDDIVILPMNKALVSTGLAVEIPEGCYGRIAPRSGLSAKKFIDVGAGVIDRDYRQEVKVLLFNFGVEVYFVKKGDRIAQLILERIETPDVIVVSELTATTRTGGFGSTGT
jgi:dUTP pyrophosphatase